MYSRDIVEETFRLKALGLTDRAIAEQCGVSVQALRHWRYGTRRSPQTEADRTAYCPVCGTGALDPAAYVYLLGLYLGDGYIGRIRNGVDYLSIACCDTWPGLIEECARTISTVFPVGAFQVRRQGCTEVKGTSKHWRCTFPQNGKGMKHSRPIILEPWQQEAVDECPEPFIRGLIHSDGCRVSNRVRKKTDGGWKYYEYPRYFFSNTSQDISNLLVHALDRLGISWRRRVEVKLPNRDAFIVSVSKRAAVARMDEFVGPKY
ncbi:LAGLIDADG family homing endonuclease [Streptomonospora nanhaiensis]|uniref:LAGLIDADG family homing endonuclease n=1 Tax=Streptomonospora nanhaiensis TaxID=1323731 RepID=A0ABY6YIC9_9ACTN|nr:LAGLIDADG family homing endonuclease [Streptomonospora nanhaiensis]WAE71949.1 LAGLIDADG family homing endonuclease [Streptomonospora nanhaiensis]